MSTRPTALVGGGGHPEACRRVLINATARSVAGTERSATHRLAAFELVLESLALAGADVLRRRQTDRLLELPLQVIRAHAGLLPEHLEGDALVAEAGDVL